MEGLRAFNADCAQLPFQVNGANIISQFYAKRFAGTDLQSTGWTATLKRMLRINQPDRRRRKKKNNDFVIQGMLLYVLLIRSSGMAAHSCAQFGAAQYLNTPAHWGPIKGASSAMVAILAPLETCLPKPLFV